METKIKDLASRVRAHSQQLDQKETLEQVIKAWITENSAFVSAAFKINPKAIQMSNTPADKILLYELKKAALSIGEVGLMECGEVAVKKTSVIINPMVDYNLSLLCWKLGGVKEMFQSGEKARN